MCGCSARVDSRFAGGPGAAVDGALRGATVDAVAARTETFDLASLKLTSGEGVSANLAVPLDALRFAEQIYRDPAGATDARLDVSRTTGHGYSMRLRFFVQLEGPCMRCLSDAGARVEVDAREVHQPAAGDEDLRSPYVEEGHLDLRAWARDALALALPVQIICREECLGLCAICGQDLNEDPAHVHERQPDPRWAKLSELKLE